MEKQSYFLALMLLFVFLIFIFKHFSSSHQNQNSAPTPPSLPIIGHLHLIKDPLHLSLTSLSRRYGPIFSLRLGCKSFLMVSSPSALEECFTKNDVVLANRPTSMAGDWLTYNYAAFTMSSYGDLWRILRKFTVVELFSSQSLQKSAKIREQEILKLVRVLHKDSRKKVDLTNLIYTYSFNIVMRAIAGKPCVGEEEIGSEAGKEILSRTRTLFSSLVNVMLGMCDYFPFLRWIGYKGMEKNAMLVHEKRDEFLQHLIDEIRTKNNAAPAPAVEEEEEKRNDNLIQALLSVQASEPDFYSDRIIKSILLVMMAAGSDTVGLTVEWGMWHLLRQPEEMQKLRQEIDENIGHDHVVNDSDLRKLPYLGCIVKESLRLRPPVPILLPHLCSQECMVGGYSIPKGTILMVNAWAVHRDPNLWNDPDKFVPHRFEGAEMEMKEKEKEGYKFMAFGAGRRACPGAAMAFKTVSLALGAFVQCFEWEKPLEDVEVHLSMQRAKPLEAVCVVRREAAHLLSNN